MKKFLKSKINRRIIISISKIVVILFGIFALVNLSGTFAYFSSSTSVESNTVSTGCWVKPTTPQLVYPSNGYKAGLNSGWVLNPYMDWTDSVTTCPLSTHIQYQYESYYDAGLTRLAYRSGLLSGSMIPAPGTPDGDYYWRVRAYDGYNWSDWSEVWLLRVDTKCPYVKITNPSDASTINGTVAIRGTVTDANPHHYWLVIEDSSGTKVAGPGTVNDTNSFTDKHFFDWDTTTVPDGTYTIKLEARDDFGNKCPNLAPVPSDPEDPNDSVDWISVTVNNTPEEPKIQPGDVVINEVMWMGSTQSSADEWIELRNMTNHPIDIGQWVIKNARHSSGNDEIMISAGKTIPAYGYFLISNYPETSANSALNVQVDEVNASLSLLNSGNGNLILKDKSGNIIDEAKGDVWPAGVNGCQKKSMERNNIPGDGTLASSWHTCEDEHCNDTTYWDVEGNNYGTPKNANLSDNDPTNTKDLLAMTEVLENNSNQKEDKSGLEINKEKKAKDLEQNQEENQNVSKPEESNNNPEENKNNEISGENKKPPAMSSENQNNQDGGRSDLDSGAPPQ